jgi:basic amino acid/polyamine antiporter, APA family
VETHTNHVRTEAETRPRTELPRKLGLLSATAVLVGTTIGTGIFRSPAGMASKVPDEGLYLLLWVIGGFFTMCGALSVAELAGSLPHTGGVFVYLREGWGRLPAFLFGWSELVIIRASARGAISTVFAEYFLRLLGVESADAVHYVAAVAIIVVAAINFLGIQFGALVQNLATTVKYGALMLLVAAAFLIGAHNPAPAGLQTTSAAGQTTLGLYGLAFISILWVYDGWADLTYVSGEVKRPERYLPMALISGTLAVIAIYLLANLAYLQMLDIGEVANSKLVAADTAYRIIGPTGVKLISIAVMISAFGTLNGSTMIGPRILFAMADDGLFFRKIASVHPRFKTPHLAIALSTVLSVVFVMFRTFEQLSDMFVLAIWPFYAIGVAAVYVLRRTRPDLPRPYRTLGYPVTPAFFIVAVMFLLTNALIDDIKNFSYYRALITGNLPATAGSGALMVFGIILLGIPVYYVWRAYHKPRTK